MDPSVKDLGDPIARTLEYEFDLVRGAIALVTAGGAPSVMLASLRFGEQLIGPAQRLGLASGVRVVPIWSGDEGGASISFERMADG